MKKLIIPILSVLTFGAFASEIQVLVIDQSHIQMGLSEGEVGEYYIIKPTKSLKIDASKYTFLKYEGMKSNRPNSIQFIIDDEHQYIVEWKKGQSIYELSKATLTPRFKKFKGLKVGDQFVLAIGQLVMNHETKEQVFKVQWAGIGKVQP